MSTNGLDALAADLGVAASDLTSALDDVAHDTAHDGSRAMKAFSRESNREHGKRYTEAIDVDPGGGSADYIYGPQPGLPQAAMNFETGSRNQKPHLDGQRSADLIDEVLPGRVGRAIDEVLRKTLG